MSLNKALQQDVILNNVHRYMEIYWLDILAISLPLQRNCISSARFKKIAPVKQKLSQTLTISWKCKKTIYDVISFTGKRSAITKESFTSLEEKQCLQNS